MLPDKIIEFVTNLNYMDVFMTQRFEWIKDYAYWFKENVEEGLLQNVVFLEEILQNF